MQSERKDPLARLGCWEALHNPVFFSTTHKTLRHEDTRVPRNKSHLVKVTGKNSWQKSDENLWFLSF